MYQKRKTNIRISTKETINLPYLHSSPSIHLAHYVLEVIYEITPMAGSIIYRSFFKENKE